MVKDKPCKPKANDLIEHIKAIGKRFAFLEQSKVSKSGKAVTATRNHSKKMLFVMVLF